MARLIERGAVVGQQLLGHAIDIEGSDQEASLLSLPTTQ